MQYNTITHITQNNIQFSWQGTPNPSMRVATDLALTPCGHWNRLSSCLMEGWYEAREGDVG